MLLLCAPVPPSPAEQAAVTLQCCCLFSQLFTKPSHVFERSHTDIVLCARHKPFSEPFLRHLFDFWRSGDQTGAGPASALLPALRPRGSLCSGVCCAQGFAVLRAAGNTLRSRPAWCRDGLTFHAQCCALHTGDGNSDSFACRYQPGEQCGLGLTSTGSAFFRNRFN